MATVERFSATVRTRDEAAPAIMAALAASEQFARRAHLTPVAAARLNVVVEELVSNALRHGACDGRAATVEMVLEEAKDHVRLEVADDCAPFDPTADKHFTGPDHNSGGGVGLALVRAWARGASYARENARNRIRLSLPTGE